MRPGLKALVSALLVALLLWRVDVAEVGRVLAVASPGLMGIAGLLFFLMHVLNALKLRVLLPELRAGRLLAYTLVAQLYALVLPGQLAGEAVKAYRLSRDEGRGQGQGQGQGQGEIGGGRIVSAVAFDKVTGIVGLLLLTGGGLAMQSARFGNGLLVGVGLVLAGLVAATVLLAWAPARALLLALLGWRAGPRREALLLGPLRRFLEAWRDQTRRPGRALLSVAGGIAVQVAAVAGSQALGLAVGIDQPFSVWGAVIGLMSVIVLMPVTVAGIGLREASLVGLLDLVGVPHAQSLALGFGILAFQVMVALLGAVIDLTVLRERRPA
ncbi:flippase-like domain-containing protein (plasmid) [Azospirillum oryzae]|uniref:Flippase-like domain-containing protein n=3 Tax=Azospirillum oryzae TaxID=286727 RepID=A0A6N1ABZ7_9PROT|nr:lysylphosphatidylglycerol synthase transmembrane domain-containing protein [Azospirillum oryzae]KAA0584380.1 flippase-like domain-containing protein [Azospirillum oryzae]QKS48990.1 flippase-like domain-containing protein [Azospirillum oryzae]